MMTVYFINCRSPSAEKESEWVCEGDLQLIKYTVIIKQHNCYWLYYYLTVPSLKLVHPMYHLIKTSQRLVASKFLNS
jgi:hypothetical protein